MKNKKTTLLTSLVVAGGFVASVAFPPPVYALEVPKVGAIGGFFASSGNVEKDIDTFLETAQKAEDLTTKAVAVLFSAVASKEEVQKAKDALEAANKLTDPKEKEAAVRKVTDDQSVALAKVDYAAKSKEIEKTADEKQKKAIGTAFYNYSLGLLKDAELVSKGSNIISSATSNPMLLPKVTRMKGFIGFFINQIDNGKKIITGMQQLNSVVKMPAAPASSSSEPVSYAD